MEIDVLVVGGGAAGVDAATAVRRRAPDASVALVSPRDELLYRPWLIYAPASAVRDADMRVSLAAIADAHGFRHIKAEVTGIDIAANEATLSEPGERVTYRELILAPGAPADRARIPGAREHALFPCDPADAREMVERLKHPLDGSVVFVLTGERIGPGLEYAGWVAKALRSGNRADARVLVVEEGDAMERQFGVRGADRIAGVAATAGVETVRRARVERIRSGALELGDSRVSAALIAVTSPLRGPDLGLSEKLLDHRGLLNVDRTLTVPAHANVRAAGDFANIHGAEPIPPKTWIMARLQAEVAAENASAGLAGTTPREIDMRKVARMAALSMPDIGGRTLLVRKRRPLLGGSWPLRLRYRMDARYLSLYRSEAGATRPAR